MLTRFVKYWVGFTHVKQNIVVKLEFMWFYIDVM